MNTHAITNMLFSKYGTWDLSPVQASEVLNRSTQTLYRMRQQATGPSYRKAGNASNTAITYPANKLAEYLLNYDLANTVA